MIRGWLILAWNVDGMTYDKYLKLGQVERFTMHVELCEMTEVKKNPKSSSDGNDDDEGGGGGAVRPKKLRR